MPSLKAIRKRIRSVRNTQQITKAMKMVAAAKLRRSQEAILAARPFAAKLEQVLSDLAVRTETTSHPLLARRPLRKVELLVITSDRGLCGGFNSNVQRRALRFLRENEKQYGEVAVSTVGRKAHDFFGRRHIVLRRDHPGVFADLDYSKAKAIAEELAARFVERKLDGVFLLYNEFSLAVSQKVHLAQLLPLPVPERKPDEKLAPVDYIYEPGRDRVLELLLPRHLSVFVFRALLESQAAEHAARMTAMDSATKNASEMIAKLTLLANRTRQAAITKELMEVVSGAEALK